MSLLLCLTSSDTSKPTHSEPRGRGLPPVSQLENVKKVSSPSSAHLVPLLNSLFFVLSALTMKLFQTKSKQKQIWKVYEFRFRERIKSWFVPYFLLSSPLFPLCEQRDQSRNGKLGSYHLDQMHLDKFIIQV
jgi:hypothetical protein